MSCEVCIGGDHDLDGHPEFYFASTPKARKDHRCEECRGVIQKGSRYDRFVSKYDGDFSEVKTCLLCAEIRRVFSCGNSYMLGELWQNMRDIAFPVLTTATDCFRELSPEAKQFVLDRWQKWKGLSV